MPWGEAASPTLPMARLMAMARIGVLVAAVLAAAHDLVYLAAYGPRAGRILEAAGHGPTWVAIAVASLLGAGALTALALHRSRVLRRRLTSLGGPAVEALAIRPLAKRILRLWLVLLLVCIAVFFVQENLEHLGHHGHFPGVAILFGPGYEWALPIFAVLTFAAAVAGSLALARIAALASAVARASLDRPSPEPPIWSVSDHAWWPRHLRSTPDLGRAPPLLAG